MKKTKRLHMRLEEDLDAWVNDVQKEINAPTRTEAVSKILRDAKTVCERY